MKVDNMITLADGRSYGILLKSVLNNKEYFLSVLLNEDEEPTEEFAVLKEEKHGDVVFAVEERDEEILKELWEDYSFQAENEEI